jgi:predicted DNA-binding transcriptional regulator AlpA
MGDVGRKLLTTAEVADLLRVPVATLYSWRWRGVGPMARRVGKRLVFVESEVWEWADAQVASPKPRPRLRRRGKR